MTKKITISSFKTKSSRNTEVRKVPNLQSPSISNIVLDLNLSQNFSFKDTLLDDENLLNANINDTKNIKIDDFKNYKIANLKVVNMLNGFMSDGGNWNLFYQLIKLI